MRCVISEEVAPVRGVLLESSRRRIGVGGRVIKCRRKWRPTQKAALLDEAESNGGKVLVVAQRHGISESLLYNYRSAWKAAASAVSVAAVDFVPLGMVGNAGGERRPLLAPPEPERSKAPQAGTGGACVLDYEPTRQPWQSSYLWPLPMLLG
jgi:transposase